MLNQFGPSVGAPCAEHVCLYLVIVPKLGLRGLMAAVSVPHVCIKKSTLQGDFFYLFVYAEKFVVTPEHNIYRSRGPCRCDRRSETSRAKSTTLFGRLCTSSNLERAWRSTKRKKRLTKNTELPRAPWSLCGSRM